MELFRTVQNGENFVYLLDGIEENFGVLDLDKRHTLVAMFEPVNRVHAVKLDGGVEENEVKRMFDLNEMQSRAFAEILNHYIANKPRDKWKDEQ